MLIQKRKQQAGFLVLGIELHCAFEVLLRRFPLALPHQGLTKIAITEDRLRLLAYGLDRNPLGLGPIRS